MKYNPHLHHRRSVRLRGNDYSREGMYFVTICTYQRALIFGSITDGQISKIQWAARPSLGQIIGAYKSSVSTECLRYHKENAPGVWLDKIWQRNYDDRMIRDAKMWKNVTQYIINNPENWKSDMFFIPPDTSP